MEERGGGKVEEYTLITSFNQSLTLPTPFPSSLPSSPRDELEKKQLQHTVQLLKLELSQKSLVIESLRTEQSAHIEELREKVSDLQHEKNLMQIRLRSVTQVGGCG